VTKGAPSEPRTPFGHASRLQGFLRPVWRDRRLGIGLAVAAAALWGLVAGWWTPRGPLTTGQALWAMAISLAIGATAGLVMRSRWAPLVAPVAFVGVFELVRRGTDGPVVDGLHASTYGVIAFVVGRGFHGLTALLPMLFGAAVGAGYARRFTETTLSRPDRRRVGLYVRRSVAVLTGVGLIALAGVVARPASTDPILRPDGEPLAGSIAELTRVNIGGHDLALMIRGNSTQNPVLLFLAGGPGGSELGAMRRHLEALEPAFVVVTWDQRGTGRSYPELDPASTLTLEGAVSDTIEVTNYLRRRFDQEKIYVVGQSWGTILGVLALQDHPDLYRAFIGTGQMVSPRETDRIIYQDTLAWARDTGNNDLVDTLTGIGPPPYESILDYEPALSYEHEVYPYDHSRNSEGEGGFSENLLVNEYSLIDKVHTFAGFLDTFSVLYPQIQDIDFREDVTQLDVPVYLVQGLHEADGRSELVDEWFSVLDAPTKQMIVLDTSGHRPLFEQPDEFVEIMTDVVLA